MNKTAHVAASAAGLIGQTPVVSRIWGGPGRLLAKAEFLPTLGSVKDRAARAIIRSRVLLDSTAEHLDLWRQVTRSLDQASRMCGAGTRSLRKQTDPPNSENAKVSHCRLAAILAAHVAGYGALMGADDARASASGERRWNGKINRLGEESQPQWQQCRCTSFTARSWDEAQSYLPFR